MWEMKVKKWKKLTYTLKVKKLCIIGNVDFNTLTVINVLICIFSSYILLILVLYLIHIGESPPKFFVWIRHCLKLLKFYLFLFFKALESPIQWVVNPV